MEAGNSEYWSSASRFDIRDLVDPSTADECLLQCGPNLRDIYCYKAHGSSVIAKHANYVRNVAIDFQNEREDEKPEEPSIRPILLQFKNLTRLRLKLNDSRYNYFYFIQHLPHTMLEIHLLGDTREHKDSFVRPPQGKRAESEKFLDLRNFTQLQALTLTGFIFDEGSLFGLGRLTNLKYLRIDDTRFAWCYQNALMRYQKLEYLSLEYSKMEYYKLKNMMDANTNLKILNSAGYNIISNNIFPLSELKQLKVLRFHMMPLRPFGMCHSQTLEYFECPKRFYLKDSGVSDLLCAFPNLKGLNVANYAYSPELISDIEEKLSEREDDSIFKLYLGRSEQSAALLSQRTSERLQLLEFPDNGYATLFDYDYFNGWYTNDEKKMKPDEVLPVIAHVTDDSTPIELLSDDCLCLIFLHLPKNEKLKMEQVCQRWKTVALNSWYMEKKLDVRDVVPHENIHKYITRCGHSLTHLYYYKSCGLTSLPTKIPNLRHLAIDFNTRYCECSSRIKEIDSLSFNRILKQFSNLTGLMLSNFDFHRMYSFLEHLPETIEEIDISNRRYFANFLRNRPPIRINISNFVNLRALALSIYGEHDFARNFIYPVLSIDGMEKLEKLKYLSLYGDLQIEYSNEPFKNITNLEKLSLGIRNNCHVVTAALVQNNRNLKRLILSDTSNLTTAALDAIFTLEKLHYLGFWLAWESGLELAGRRYHGDVRREMPSLKYLDCNMTYLKTPETLQTLVEYSPNLKVVNITNVRPISDIRGLIEAGNRATKTRICESPLEIYFVSHEVIRFEHLVNSSPHVVFGNKLVGEYYRSLRWNSPEWWLREDNYA